MLNLRELRKRKGFTLEELGRMVGVSKVTISRWETGEIADMKRDKIIALASALGIDPMEIIFPEYEERTEKTRVVRVPIVGSIACGTPVLAQENIVGYELASVEDLKKHCIYFYLKCKGDSMSPTIESGSKVLIRKQETVENGEIAAVLSTESNEATLKRVKFDGNDTLLIPDNRDYLPIIVNDNHPIKILGKAIQVVNSL